ncbi:MAG TPA: guanylate kinase [Saprospiraceae bacterium]|nr:guanylate kinase [Saprospiraceae bacterium]
MSQSSKKQNKIGKVLIITAPSGSGKTTIVRHLINHFDQLAFSISATTRSKRKNEIHGRDYYFIDRETFLTKVENGEFIEWEEVYDNQYYGTLKSEVEKLWHDGKIVVFDIEVKGATFLKNLYSDNSLAIFVKVPTMEKLYERLKNRKTEDKESIKRRMQRIKREMAYETLFDIVLYNDHLPQTLQNAEKIVEDFIKSSYK